MHFSSSSGMSTDTVRLRVVIDNCMFNRVLVKHANIGSCYWPGNTHLRITQSSTSGFNERPRFSNFEVI